MLAEVDHLALARFGRDARSSLIDFILFQARRERFLIPHVTIGLLDVARTVQRKYAGLSLDLADAVNVSLAAEHRTDCVLTLDRRDFRAIRPLTPHPAFRLFPYDMLPSPLQRAVTPEKARSTAVTGACRTAVNDESRGGGRCSFAPVLLVRESLLAATPCLYGTPGPL